MTEPGQPARSASGEPAAPVPVHEHLETVFRSVADGLLLVDSAGRIVLANPAALEQFAEYGHAGPVVGQPLEALDLSLVDADGGAVTAADLARVLTELDPAGESRQVGARTAGGTRRWFDIRLRTSGAGDERMAVVSFRDVTEQRRRVDRARRLERLQALLADVNEVLTRGLEPGADGERSDVSEFLQQVCELAVAVGGYRAARIGTRDDTGVLRAEAADGAPLSAPDLGELDDPRQVTVLEDGTVAWTMAAISGPEATGVLALAEPVSQYADDDERSLVLELAADISHGMVLHAQASRRREAERAVRASEEWFRALVQHASDSIAVIAEDRSVVYLSPGGAAIVGRPAEALLGAPAEDLVDPRDREVLTAMLDDAVIDPETNPRRTLRVLHADGTVRWVSAVADNQLANPSVGGIVLNSHDITQEHQTMRRLELQARLLESVGEAVIATDRPGRVIHWNDVAERLFGWSEHEALGRAVTDLVPPAPGSEVVEAIVAAARRGAPWSGEIEVRRRDGTFVPIQLFSNPVFDDDGRLTALIGTCFDITERRRAETDAMARARQHATVAALSQQVLRSRDVHESLAETVDAVRESLRVDVVYAVVRRDESSLTVAATSGSDHLTPGRALEGGDADLACHVLASDCVVTTEDLVPVFAHSPMVRADGAGSALATRIQCDGEPEGAIIALSRSDRRSTPEEVDFLRSVGNLLSAAMEAARSEEKLQQLALHDSLTGLPNRTLFQDRLDMALRRLERHGDGIAVLFCDLDRFKMVNDALGHAVGDELLRAVAQRLLELVRPGDTVARLGGDEFAVLCDGIDDATVGMAVARRITRTLARDPVVVAGTELFANLSVGVATCVDAGSTSDELLRNADAAMYRAKDLGRGRAELYAPEERDVLVERFEMTTALRTALGQEQFTLVYQPELELDGPTIWIEALLRWEHPSRGLLEPATFMALAEETGEISAIGAWVLRRALADLRRWRATDPSLAPSCLAVNLSARQLQEPSLVAAVEAALEESGIEPEALWFEITETALLRQRALAEEVLADLKDLGVGLAIDDFGTGYSSLSYAQRLPADALKIDRSFVSGVGSDLRNHSIASAVVSLAHSLEILAIAEGVETDQQLETLRALDCDFAQGYLWARPLPADEVIDWIRGHRCAAP